MTSKPLTRVVGRIKSIRAKQTNAKALSRRGEFNILWAIVAVVGIALGLFMIFYVFHGTMPSLGASNTLTVTAEELGGVLVINMKAMGVSATKINAIQLVPSSSSASSCAAYLDETQIASGVSLQSITSVTLKPGDTLTISCTSITGSPTEVEVFTTTGTYITPIS